MVRRLLSAETERYLAEQHRRERGHGEDLSSRKPVAKDDISQTLLAHSPRQRPSLRSGIITLCLTGALLWAAMIWFATRQYQP